MKLLSLLLISGFLANSAYCQRSPIGVELGKTKDYVTSFHSKDTRSFDRNGFVCYEIFTGLNYCFGFNENNICDSYTIVPTDPEALEFILSALNENMMFDRERNRWVSTEVVIKRDDSEDGTIFYVEKNQ